jgi:aerobic-type carbon monoxide dehydrogenase small subunit (CoxS/CutS family)
MTTYHLTVNGTPRSVEASDPDEPLLYILRNALGLKAAKFGCGRMHGDDRGRGAALPEAVAI